MPIHYPKGSEWRKWDLHFHTPSSYDYYDKSITNEKIIEVLKENKIALAVVTDHHVIDVDRIKKLRKLAGDDLTVLAGIELRSELGGSESIHFIGIFSEDSNLNETWIKLQGQFDLLPENINKIGNDKIYVNLKEATQCIHNLGGIVSIHAGRKSNSIENIKNNKNNNPYKDWQKEKISEYIDLFEIGKPEEDQESYKTIVFPKIGQTKPIIICSDNHDIKNYSNKANCWIKADPTFEGLKQIIREPEDRVYIGEIPPKIDLLNKNKTKYINKISIKKDSDISYDKDLWFDNEIEFNDNLIAIIGNKGKGKSALAEIIGSLGNSRNFEYFSFLDSNKFKKNKLASYYVAEIEWADRARFSKNLMNSPDLQEMERVKCIPQNYLEKLCTSLGSEFQDEIDKVVFSHIDETELMGEKNLKDIINLKATVPENNIAKIRNNIIEINRTIIEIEEKLEHEYLKSIESKLNLMIEELRSHYTIRPQKVIKPEKSELIQDEQKKLYEDLSKINEDIKQIKDRIKNNTDKLIQINKKIEKFNIINGKIKEIKILYDNLKNGLNQGGLILGESLEIKLEDIIKIEINDPKIIEIFEFLRRQKGELSQLINKNYINNPENGKINNNLYKILEEKQKNKNDLQSRLNEPIQKYQKYLEELKEWKYLFRNKNSEKKSLKKELSDIKKEIPESLKKEEERREILIKELFNCLNEEIAIYKTLYSPIIEFIRQERGKNEYMDLNFSAEIMLHPDFNEKFLSFIDRSRKGSFQGVEGSQNLLKDITHKYDFSNIKEVINFLNEIKEKLQNESINGLENKRVLESQLIQGKTKNNIYDFLYSLEFLKIDYRLKWGDKLIEDLSPGERGIVLLLFYLLIDKSDVPLIIDQPEDNLDNESIYNLLVKYIKQAKNRRQIFIVTHNPNLAVVCDAEQIIYCNLDKKNRYKISYETGSIENPEVKKNIINVLEGTKPAFNNRQSKYEL
jgi:ABC-type lipoprotein export system ATPase subunit